MILLAASAAFVGLIHSLAPGHWLPVVLMAKTKRWPMRTAVLGALTAAMGHIIISSSLGIASIAIGLHFLAGQEEQLEKYAGLMLLVFGLAYATWSYTRHSSCHGHEHHGPDPKSGRGPFVFLFSLGFSPCVAVVPVFAAAAPQGSFSVMMTMAAFSFGVLTALIGSTLLVSLGLVKLDHPIFEHHGDVITGLGIAVLGSILFFYPL